MIILKYGIYLVIFSMPLYLWSFSFFGIPVNFLEMMIYILFMLWLSEKIRRLKSKKEIFSLIDSFKQYYFSKEYCLLHLGITLLFLGVIISTSLSSDLRTSLGIFKGWFVSPFLFFIVFINVIKKNEQIIWSLKSWLVSGVVVALISIFYLLIGEMTFDGRLKALFLSPNYLAMYLAPVLLIIIAFVLSTEKKKKLLNLIMLIIILVPLYFTFSYGAFLGIFAGILYLIIKNRNLKIRKAYIFAFILILFSGFIYLSLNKFDQISNSGNRSSFHSRIMIWDTAREIVEDNPLLGIGPGTFQETYLSYANEFSEPYLEWAVPQPHNIFLAFYLQTGIIGFLGFIFILIWLFSCRDMALSSLKSTGSVNYGFEKTYIINALMIYILAHGFVDTTFWKNDLALMFWIIVGIKFIQTKQYNSLNNENKSVDNNLN